MRKFEALSSKLLCFCLSDLCLGVGGTQTAANYEVFAVRFAHVPYALAPRCRR